MLGQDAAVHEPIAGAFFAHIPGFLVGPEADAARSTLEQELPWQHLPVKVFGKSVMQPRLTHYAADEGLGYTYAGLQLPSHPWHPLLLELRQRIETATGWHLNAVLCNFYRNGQDSMGWHSDDEPELGPSPAIASLSFGGPRVFRVRLKQRVAKGQDRQVQLSYELAHGDLLLMWGRSQELTQHAVPRSKRLNEPRLNLTFRLMLRP
jgi:alkylated DNA repair dioxygenase AlkB